MNLYSSKKSLETGRNFVCGTPAHEVIQEALILGDESRQIRVLQELTSVLTEKMLQANVVRLEDISFLLNELPKKYSVTASRVVLEED